MNYIKETGIQFDVGRLEADYREIHRLYTFNQINLRKRAQDDNKTAITYGAGSLMVENGGTVDDSDRSWTEYNPLFDGKYIIDVCKRVEDYAKEKHNVEVGRARIMLMQPKSCLTYHIDYDNVMRFHVPIVTSPNCFFINNEVIGRMDKAGELYEFDNTVMHTAVNASRRVRAHLVICGYK